MSNIIPLPPKIAKAKPPVKRNELILVMARRLIEQAREACNKSADKLEAEEQAINLEVLKLSKEKPVAEANWWVGRSDGWSNDEPVKGVLYIRCCEVRYANVKVQPTEELKRRMLAYKESVYAHTRQFGWLPGVHDNNPRSNPVFGKSERTLLSVAKEKARALLGEQPVVPTSTEQRVSQMLADPEFMKATDLFIKRLQTQPKQLTARTA